MCGQHQRSGGFTAPAPAASRFQRGGEAGPRGSLPAAPPCWPAGLPTSSACVEQRVDREPRGAQRLCQEPCAHSWGWSLTLDSGPQKPDPPALWPPPQLVCGAVGGFFAVTRSAVASSVAPGGPHSLAALATATIWARTAPGKEHSLAWARRPLGRGQRRPTAFPPPSLAQHRQGPRDSGGGAAGCPPRSGGGEECAGRRGRGRGGRPLCGGRPWVCTKQACVSPEWVALSRVLTGRAWALWHHARLPGPGPVCQGRWEVWPSSLG